MKINTELLKAVQEQEINKNKSPEQAKQDFKQVLEKNMSSEQDANKNQKSAAQMPGPNQLAALHAQIQTNSTSSVQSEGIDSNMREKIDQVLSQWEKYSQQLQSGENGLKSSFSTLEDISENVRKLQKDLSENSKEGQGIKSILNELEIMTVTERVKLNRGDYH